MIGPLWDTEDDKDDCKNNGNDTQGYETLSLGTQSARAASVNCGSMSAAALFAIPPILVLSEVTGDIHGQSVASVALVTMQVTLLSAVAFLFDDISQVSAG